MKKFYPFALFFIYASAHAAAGYLINSDLNTQNPAEISVTNKYQIILEAQSNNARIQQTDLSINGVYGSAPSSCLYILPFFRLAYRLDPQWVFGVDFNHPSWTQQDYRLNSFVNAESVQSIYHTFNINPRVSYQINSFLSLGLGFDVVRSYGVISSNQNPAYGPLFIQIENGQGWGYGWDAGFNVNVTKKTTVSLAFFSQTTSTVVGQSSYLNFHSDNARATLPVIPTTFLLHITQEVTSALEMEFYGIFDEQSTLEETILRNSALGNFVSPQQDSNSFYLDLQGTYQWNPRWSLQMGFSYEDNPQPLQTNNISNPTGTAYSVFLGPKITLNKRANLLFTYSLSWEPSRYNYLSPQGPIMGRTNTTTNTFDLQLTFAE